MLEAHDVDRSGEGAGLVPMVLALDEAGVGEAAERPGSGVLADPELEGDVPDVGDGIHAPATVVGPARGAGEALHP